MKIELKNIKHSEFASHETNCYEATIYINGKREGVVSNDGQGGCDSVHPWQLAQEIDAYAKTLPPVVCEWIDPKTGEPFVLEQTHETIFGELLTDWLVDKDLKRSLKTKIIFMKEDGKIYASKTQKPAELKLTLSIPRLAERLSAKVVLNNLPYAEAKQIYRSSANV
jgi:hypothetical protein